jgi:hypothetical protein
MHPPKSGLRRFRDRFLIVLFAVFLLAMSACGSSKSDVPLARVIDHPNIFMVDDLRTNGMKASKNYDVADLPGGVDAWYGFIQTESGPMDIEVRFYASHADAVALGTELAEEVSGDDANIEEETTTWVVGYKDRQRMRSGGTADLAAWSGKRGPNYGDFVIFGNMVLLCQGDDPEESLVVCHELITSLGGASAGAGG